MTHSQCNMLSKCLLTDWSLGDLFCIKAFHVISSLLQGIHTEPAGSVTHCLPIGQEPSGALVMGKWKRCMCYAYSFLTPVLDCFYIWFNFSIQILNFCMHHSLKLVPTTCLHVKTTSMTCPSLPRAVFLCRLCHHTDSGQQRKFNCENAISQLAMDIVWWWQKQKVSSQHSEIQVPIHNERPQDLLSN